VASVARWGISPAPDAAGLPRDEFELEIGPGQTEVDHVSVTNLSDESLVFEIYAADGVITPDGQPAIVDRATPAEDLGTWIGFNVSQIEVPPGERIGLPFRVTAPDSATPGDHCGGIVASLYQDPELLDATGLTVDARTAVWVCVTVPGAVASEWAVQDFAADYQPARGGFGLGRLTVTARIVNTGNLRQAGVARVTAAGPAKVWRTEGPEFEVPMLLPGQSHLVTQVLEDVPPALWADAGLVVEAAAREGYEQAPLVRAGARTWLAPWIAAIALTLLTAGLWRLLTRRPRRRAQIERAVQARLAEADAAPSPGRHAKLPEASITRLPNPGP
jgi:hypothetical protein